MKHPRSCEINRMIEWFWFSEDSLAETDARAIMIKKQGRDACTVVHYPRRKSSGFNYKPDGDVIEVSLRDLSHSGSNNLCQPAINYSRNDNVIPCIAQRRIAFDDNLFAGSAFALFDNVVSIPEHVSSKSRNFVLFVLLLIVETFLSEWI